MTENEQGETLVSDLCEHGTDVCVVLCHGFGANRRLGLIHRLQQSLCDREISSCAFDFSGNGESEGAFAEATAEKQVSDLTAMLDALEENGFSRFVTIGQSLGGSIVLIHQAKDERVDGCVTLAAPTDPARNLEENADWLHVGASFEQPQVKGMDFPDRPRTLTKAWIDSLHDASIPPLRVSVIAFYASEDRIVSPLHGQLLAEQGADVRLLNDTHVLLDSEQVILEAIEELVGSL